MFNKEAKWCFMDFHEHFSWNLPVCCNQAITLSPIVKRHKKTIQQYNPYLLFCHFYWFSFCLWQGVTNFVSDDEAAYESNGDRDNRPTLRLGGTKSRLFIDCVSAEDAGDYTCVAETPFKRITTTTTVQLGESHFLLFCYICVILLPEYVLPIVWSWAITLWY